VLEQEHERGQPGLMVMLLVVVVVVAAVVLRGDSFRSVDR
jgi:hypothetical protein